MKKTKIKWIDRCLVENPYYVGLCRSEKAFMYEMKRLKVENPPKWINIGSDGATHILESGKGENIAIVCIIDNKNTTELLGLIIHEAVHVWQWVKDNIGESDPSHEFEAYSIQMIAQRLIEKAKLK